MSTSDRLTRLPINTTHYPTHSEARVMNTLFGGSSEGQTENTAPIVTPAKQGSPFKILVYAALFVILNLKIVDEYVKEKIASSEYAVIGVKTGFFLIVMLVFQLLGW